VICKTKEKKKGESNTQVKSESKAKKYNNPFNCRNGDAELKKRQKAMMLTQTKTTQRYHSDRMHQLNRCVELSIPVVSICV